MKRLTRHKKWRPKITRRAHPDTFHAGVLEGPVWKGWDDIGWQRNGPRYRIQGRWRPALLSSRLLYVKFRRDIEHARYCKLQAMAERCNLARYNGLPF